MTERDMGGPAFPYSDRQRFDTFGEWVNRASSWLTAHPRHHNSEHNTDGWNGHHFTAICFDTKGRVCRNGGDFMRARDEDCFPVRFIWPDQFEPVVFAHIAMLAARKEQP
jgi:hypothetical protein